MEGNVINNINNIDVNLNRLANSHIGRLLGKLDDENCPEIYKDIVRGRFWLFAYDVDSIILKGNVKNDTGKRLL